MKKNIYNFRSIIRRYVDNQFSKDYKATVGVDFALKEFTHEDKSVRLQLWDIAGQERFSALTHVYYKEAAAACIVFDLTDKKTFTRVQKWRNDVAEKVKLPNDETVPMLLLGNKSDMDHQEVDHKEVDQFAKENGFIGWFPCSAATNLNLEKAFELLTSVLLEKGVEPLTNKGNNLNLRDGDQSGNVKTKGCCNN
eukprot:TRINITY_DN105_c0_g1_i2.p1 TRINITY_DN105_c0_g1~~TRINITY_DN105_c0_g1_i2.p1  ORF type:complete len:195 (-),score=39.01 TRINITY_DN105_c0_g1_i2:104-688(-)